jgi:AcrR family transcriptional regulator
VTPARPRARKGEGELLRDEILEAAEALLLETASEEAVSIRAVAQAVGVTAPSIYRHFPDKTHLLFEVCARQFELLDEVIEEAVSGIDDPLEAMAARGRAYVRFGVEHPEHYRIMFMGSAQATPEQWQDIVRTGSFANLITGIERLRDADLLPADIDPYETALHVWATIHGLTSLLVTKPGIAWPELEGFVEDHLEQCFLAQMVQARGVPLAGSGQRSADR